MTSVDECWVLVEAPQGKILRESLEALGAARSMQRQFPGPLVAVWIGSSPEPSDLEHLQSLGVHRLLHQPLRGEITCLVEENCLNGLRALYGTHRPACLLAGTTTLSRTLAPKLAVLEGAGYVPRVTYLRHVGDRLQMTRPLVRGKVSEILRFVSDTPGVISLSPGSFPLPRPSAHRSTEPLSCETQPAHPPDKRVPLNVELLSQEEGPLEALDLEDADVVVAGGKGMGCGENFLLLQELAALLGGTVAASRIAVDLGWAGKERLVGQTGRKISPELYIACGISGAPQHRAGLRDPRYLLAINTDKDAPIFRNATWAVRGDALQILPEWIRLLKESRS